jgi:hypothetical protein
MQMPGQNYTPTHQANLVGLISTYPRRTCDIPSSVPPSPQKRNETEDPEPEALPSVEREGRHDSNAFTSGTSKATKTISSG